MHVTEHEAAPARALGASSAALPWIAVGVLTVLGLALRLVVADQALFGDELATYWVITTYGLPKVVSVVHTNAEITPPLSFVLSWLTAQLSHAEEYIRAPSLAAGTATIPLVYLLGLRTVGRPAALVATALTALSPFMIYYSAEARAYAVMMLLVVVSTLAMLHAADGGGVRWWMLYAVSSCLAMYSHYTCAFALAAQLAWLFWAHPGARRAALLANVGAAILFLPWATGLRKDFTSPTSDILSILTPIAPRNIASYVEHWAFGFPYPYVPIDEMPGVPALLLLGGGALLALGGLAVRHPRFAEMDRRLVLLVALALSVPVGTGLASLVGNNIIGVRNLAASWPAFALALAALLVKAGPRLRYATVGLALLAFVIGAAKMLDPDYGRPDHHASADFVEREARPGDVVIDATALTSPGPLSTLDTTLTTSLRVLRAGVPAQKDHPFNFQDRIVPIQEAFFNAASLAGGNRIFYVKSEAPETPGYDQRQQALSGSFAKFGYRRVASRTFPGFITAQVDVFAKPG